MTEPQKMREEWMPCPPGKLVTLAGHERVRQRRRFLGRVGTTVGAVALASGAGWLALRRTAKPAEPIYGGIACSQVRELAVPFMTGKLDPAITQQIKTHLEHCDACRKLLESMQPKMSAPKLSVQMMYGRSN